ncbi:membrane protein [Mycobacterium noviomagense]|uniref:Membrane protein n=1 Tax=Mycobacterium noviomagense TaxID=459858 RepID=A0A7I7PJE5_9MYCO|nr:membrane protein [Mycobacterium noviomagense]
MALTWLGGGHVDELGERHERSTHAIAGVVVLLGAVLAWIAATVVVGQSVRWPVAAVLPLTLVVGLLVGAVTRATANGPIRSRAGVLARGAVAVGVGVLVAELAGLVMFSGSIDRRLQEQAAQRADSTPAVAQASGQLDRARAARAALDQAVEQARAQRDEVLVIARCEYHPTPACPQTRITGVPGTGPETRASNELLADAQRELDTALAARERRAPELDATVAADEQALDQARRAAVADADRGLGARWVAMYGLTFASAGVLVLRLLTVAFCALLYLLPLVLRLWRGETTYERHAAARDERDRAELQADTAIAVKRAEVREAAETMWAEQQLASARLAVEAQTEIDRAQHRRRVAEAIEGPVRAASERVSEADDDDMYLPIAAEAEAASKAAMQAVQLPAGKEPAVENLPAPVETGAVEPQQQRGSPLIPDVTKAAARWVRPLVPGFVARAIDTTTQPLRAARQVFEEVEEISFSLKRTRRVTVSAEERVGQSPPEASAAAEHTTESSLPAPDDEEQSRLGVRFPGHVDFSVGSAGRDQLTASQGPREVEAGGGPPELGAPEGPRQLPPGQ